MTGLIRKLICIFWPKVELTPTQKSFIEQVQRGDIIIHENGFGGFRVSRNPESIKIDPDMAKSLSSLVVGRKDS